MNLFKLIKKYCKFIDHCHYIGKCGGVAHSICNLCYKENRFIPVMVQNASVFDNHLILREIAKAKQKIKNK